MDISKVNKIAELLKKIFSIERYQFFSIKIDKNVFEEEFIVYSLIRDDEDRIIEFIIYPKNCGEKYNIIMIKKNPFEGYENIIWLKDFLVKKLEIRDDLLQRFKINLCEGNIEKELKVYFEFIIDLFKKYMSHIIWSDKWESIPFDWGLYK